MTKTQYESMVPFKQYKVRHQYMGRHICNMATKSTKGMVLLCKTDSSASRALVVSVSYKAVDLT